MQVQHQTGKSRRQGLSRREYAQRRGVTDTTVRRYVASGLLAPAILPDDTIDAGLADEILARGLTRGNGAIPGIEAARKRKLAAEIALLQDEVTALQNERMSPEAGREFVRSLLICCAKHCARVPGACAHLAGKEPVDCFTSLTEIVFHTLTAISKPQIEALEAIPEIQNEGAGGVRLDGLDLTQLAALKADLQAQRLEIGRATTRGETILIAELQTDIIDRVSNFRARLLALPSRSAPLFQSLGTADEARAMTFDLTAECLAQLEGNEMTATELKEILRDAQ